MVTRMDFNENSKPIYLQIADRLCDEVTSGLYPAGGRIPSVREYAGVLQVNFNTVMRSYEFLAARGIIFNKRGVGYFISPGAMEAIDSMRQETFFNDELQYFFNRLRVIGVSPARLSELYNRYLENHDS